MATVRDELSRIHEDTGALVSLVESGTDISRDLSEDLSRFAGDVQLALREHSHATAEYVGQLDDRLSDLRDRFVTAVEAAGGLLYKGQQELADQISRSVVGAGVMGGLFSLLGTAIAGRLVSNAIHDAAESRPLTPDELKEKALLLLVAKIQEERSYIPVDDIIGRAAGANAIMSAEDVRRTLVILDAEGVLERKSVADSAPVRINIRHPKAREACPDRVLDDEDSPGPSLPDFVDLGQEFGVSMGRSEVEQINNIRILEIKKEYIVRIDYSGGGYSRWHDSLPKSTRDEAERVRLLAHSRLREGLL